MTKQQVLLYCDAFAATQDSAAVKTAMEIAKECVRKCIVIEKDTGVAVEGEVVERKVVEGIQGEVVK